MDRNPLLNGSARIGALIVVVVAAFWLAGGTSLGQRTVGTDISNVSDLVATSPPTTTTQPPVVTTTTAAPEVEVAAPEEVRSDLPILKATSSEEDVAELTGSCAAPTPVPGSCLK